MSPRSTALKATSHIPQRRAWPGSDSWEAPGIDGSGRAEGEGGCSAMAAGPVEAKYESGLAETGQHNGGGGPHPTN